MNDDLLLPGNLLPQFACLLPYSIHSSPLLLFTIKTVTFFAVQIENDKKNIVFAFGFQFVEAEKQGRDGKKRID